MGIEIEAKMKLDDGDDLEPLLRRLGATPVYQVVERDAFFDDNRGGLREAGCGLRLRIRRFLDSDRPDVILVTCKGPLQPGELKIRREIEFTVDAADPVIDMLGMLGYAPRIAYEKRRHRWTLDGCFIELDRLPHLGRFIEIEGPDEPAVYAVRAKLGLADNALLHTSYIALLSNHLARHNIDSRDIMLET